MGRGLVQPADGFHADSVASHPEVLDLLAHELVAEEFDLRHVIRIICHTRAYQRTSRPVEGNAADTALYSHMAIKSLRPEMLYDSLSVLLYPVPPKGSKPGSKPPPPRPRALPEISRSEFVVMFGTRPDETEGSIVNSGVPQFLRLLNGKLLNSESPGLGRLLKGEQSPDEAIDAIYLAALSRRPTADELELMTDFVAAHRDDRDGYAGALWALVNSAEFVLNH
jgi:hypothetical protein